MDSMLVVKLLFLCRWCVSVFRVNISQPGFDHVCFVLSSGRFVVLLSTTIVLCIMLCVGDGMV